MMTIEFIEGEPADALAERVNEDASYHSRMINLAVGESEARTEEFNLRDASHWTRGVRDARHAAAEIALEADTRIAELEAQSERRRVLLEMSDARVCRLWERIRELKAEAGRLRAALEEIAEGRFYCADGDCRAIETAQAALSHAEKDGGKD